MSEYDVTFRRKIKANSPKDAAIAMAAQIRKFGLLLSHRNYNEANLLELEINGKPLRLADCYGLQHLTKRELEIAKEITEGLTMKEIACKLKISTKTVECHKYNILKRLNLHSCVQLAVLVTRSEFSA